LEQSTDNIKLQLLQRPVQSLKSAVAILQSMIAWIPFAFSDTLKLWSLAFDGSNLGYEAGKNGVVGQVGGVAVVETDDSYFPATYIDVVVVDKRAVIRVTPKMDPATGSGMKLIKDVPGHGGSELQLRARGDVFVFRPES
jgi:hypothetical protein